MSIADELERLPIRTAVHNIGTADQYYGDKTVVLPLDLRDAILAALRHEPPAVEVEALVERLQPYCDSIEFEDREMGAWTLMVRAADALTTLDRQLTIAKGEAEWQSTRALEASMLAYKWMEAHDKLHAGKPYSFPEVADLPNTLAEAEALRAQLAEAREALVEIRDLQPRPYEGPEFDSAASEACPECRSYAGHPIQQGICTEHRKPFEAARRHEAFEEDALGHRCKIIARAFLTSTDAGGGERG